VFEVLGQPEPDNEGPTNGQRLCNTRFSLLLLSSDWFSWTNQRAARCARRRRGGVECSTPWWKRTGPCTSWAAPTKAGSSTTLGFPPMEGEKNQDSPKKQLKRYTLLYRIRPVAVVVVVVPHPPSWSRLRLIRCSM